MGNKLLNFLSCMFFCFMHDDLQLEIQEMVRYVLGNKYDISWSNLATMDIQKKCTTPYEVRSRKTYTRRCFPATRPQSKTLYELYEEVSVVPTLTQVISR